MKTLEHIDHVAEIITITRVYVENRDANECDYYLEELNLVLKEVFDAGYQHGKNVNNLLINKNPKTVWRKSFGSWCRYILSKQIRERK